MLVRFKKLHPEARAPERATDGAAGFDLTAVEITRDEKNNVHSIDTGIAVEIPHGFVGLLFPRSSIFKTGQILANCVGVIDSDYRGPIKLNFSPLKDALLQPPYQVGDRVGQLILMPILEVELEEANDLEETKRGQGGFGSSGR